MQRWILGLMVGLAACGSDPTDTTEESVRAQDAGKAANTSKTADAGKKTADAGKNTADAGLAVDAGGRAIEGLTLRSDVKPVTRVEDALPGVFIPPFESCVEPRPGDPAGPGPDGKVCTNVGPAGATEPGRKYADYASCDVVLRQRPFWSVPPLREGDPNDPRLNDPAYLSELAWVTEQVEAAACVCCHDSKVLGKQAGKWDIRAGTLWLDSLSDPGLALFAGLADSSVLGAYPPADNHGFDRSVTGIPTTDNARMQAFMLAELARRGISEEEARAVPPFGGPIYTNRVAPPVACAAEGVTPEGRIVWTGGDARYVYVMREESENPGVPPNLDLPEGTLFRLDVLASDPPVASGVPYGTTPAGTFQMYPERERAPELVPGTRYHLYVLADVAVPLVNCVFTFGEPIEVEPPKSPDAGAPSPDASTPAATDGGTCTLPNDGFGATCKVDADCPCAANYCALMPGQKTGTCTKTGCKDDPSLCPSGYRCFDLSVFAANLPAICTK